MAAGRSKKKDDINRRIEEAAEYVAHDRLCPSPQCGFASTEEGNILDEHERRAKLRMIVGWPTKSGVTEDGERMPDHGSVRRRRSSDQGIVKNSVKRAIEGT